MLRKSSIPALRQQIDRVDDQLLRLLNRRARFALEIARQKARTNSGVYAPGREKGVIARLARANPGPLPERLVRAIFREIISASRSLEQHLRVAYLGTLWIIGVTAWILLPARFTAFALLQVSSKPNPAAMSLSNSSWFPLTVNR